MVRQLFRSRVTRATVRVLVAVQMALLLPAPDGRYVLAFPKAERQVSREELRPEPQITANRTVPRVISPSSTLTFSAAPTIAEIFQSSVFPEPLVPVGGTPSIQENAALTRVLLNYHQRGDVQWIAPLMTFLESHPQTPWRASLLVNVAALQRQSGAFARAMTSADGAWLLAKDATDANGRAVADLALAESLTIAATFGQSDMVATRFKTVGNRDIRGTAGARVARARETAAMIASKPEGIIASGPEAVRVLWALQNRRTSDSAVATAISRSDAPLPSALKGLVPTARGTSLAEVSELAQRSGLRMQMAKRVDANTVPVPAIMHWKLRHFSAVVEQRGDQYRIVDVALGGSRWIARDTLLDESSGYWLLPNVPQGWSQVSSADAAVVIGHSCPPGGAPPRPPCTDPCCCKKGGGGAGMPVYSFNHVTASLLISDQPTTYTAPRGPDVTFTLEYDHRDETQPQIFSYANMGPMWAFKWARFVQEQPQACGQICDPAHVWVRLENGGAEVYENPDAQGVYGPHWSSQAALVRTSTNPLRYERRLSDGAVEVYGQPNSGPVGQKRVFLTELRDPQGLTVTLTWDAQFRLMSITDAVAHVSTLAYEYPSDPLKVTRFTDPYGRSAQMSYTPAGQLASITDTLGLTTTFSYGAGDFVVAMRTPYGVTTFRHESWNGDDRYTKRFIEATDPLGGTEHVEFRWYEPSLASSESPAPVGFSAWNANLGWYNTFYWDKLAWPLGANDITKATITRWVTKPEWVGGTPFSVPVPHSMKKPLEQRVWYKYPGQTSIAPDSLGSFRKPSTVARVLDDGMSQIREYTYNGQGQPTLARDPVGRETTYQYAANGIDLVTTRQKNAGAYDLLESRTYDSQHRPLTVTDAAGETTTYTYNSAGQVLTATNANSETTTYTYDGVGRLMSVAGPLSGAVTTYTRDSYGRVQTITDPDGYSITLAYDVFDRSTRVTFPDGTYEDTVYNRLDPEQRRDRLGRWTRTSYDALRRPVSFRDALGRVMTQHWCTCGSLQELIDARGIALAWDRDIQGRVTKETRADGSFRTLVYETTTSRLKSITDAKNQTITYMRSLDDNVVQQTYTNASIATPDVSFTFDAAYDRLTTLTDGTGTSTFTYYPAGSIGGTLPKDIDGPLTNDTVTYVYDELSRLNTRTLNGSTLTWAYDSLGRPTSQLTSLGTFQFNYDGATNRVSSILYPNGIETSYVYFGNSKDRRLQTLTNRIQSTSAMISRFDYDYDSAGNVISWRQQSATNPAEQYVFDYDRANQITAATLSSTDPTPAVLKRYGYAYDVAANRLVAQVDDMVVGATYDNLNRLTSTQPGGVVLFRGSVNEPASVTVGGNAAEVSPDNRFVGRASVPSGTSNVEIVAADANGNTRSRTYQLDQTGGAHTLSYDANGNLISDGVKTFQWDAENRLTAVLQGSAVLASFTYDATGRRHQKVVDGVTHTYVYDGAEIAEERLSSGATIRYWHGLGIDRHLAMQDQTGVATYFVGDHLGSVTQTLNAAANITLTRQYDPWGKMSAGETAAGFAFTGREWDPETDLYFYRNRYYSALLGRFISEDPTGVEGGVNFYAYVEASPISGVDPFGTTCSSNTKFLRDWLSGALPCQINHSSSSSETQEMMNSAGAQKMRQEFAKNKCQATSVVFNSGEAAVKTLPNPCNIGAQVGGFIGQVAPIGKCQAQYTITNVAGTKSFFYHVAPDRKGCSGPMHNVTQTFKWTEASPCKTCGC
jgi:RHS repeat-associated protein